MTDKTFLEIPIIRVRDKISGKAHDVGSDEYDRLYLDEDGHIQYISLRTLKGTKDGAYYFTVDGYHNPVFTPCIRHVGKPLWDNYYFPMCDPAEYMRDELIGRIDDLQSEISEYEDDLEAAQDTIEELERRYCTR